MSVKQLVESKYFKVAAITSGVFFIALLSFALGVRIGLHKAFFSTRFGENYERNFIGGPENWDGRMMSGFGRMMKNDDRGVRNPHGVRGEIISISGDTLIIKDRNNQESSIRVGSTTSINRGREVVALNTLTVGNQIIVVGKPGDDGVITAELIRVFETTAR